MAKITLSFVLNTDRDSFAAWLMEHWPFGAHIQPYRLERLTAAGQALLVAAAVWRKQYPDGELVTARFDDAVRFALVPLGAQRVEVTVTLDLLELLPAIADLLDAMAERWPELRGSLQVRHAVLWTYSDAEQREIAIFGLRLRELCITVDRAAGVISTKATEQQDTPRRGASTLAERVLSDADRDTAIKYLHRLWRRKGNSPSRQHIAEQVGVGDYRTIEQWLTVWPEIQRQAKEEWDQGKKRN